MADLVRVDAGERSTITIDRPEALNALNVSTLDALETALDEVEAADSRVAVLTGAGERAFAAGADVEYMSELSTPQAQAYMRQGQRMTRRLETFPCPVIAAVNGYAFGGGCELVLGCDLRVASERAVFGQTEIDFGVIPGWGGSQRLPRLVGDEVARRMIYFGERIDAQDAQEYGLVGDVVAHDELDDYVDALADDLIEQPAAALRAAKAAINRTFDGSLEAGLAFERRACSGLFGTHDQREGMQAFLDDRDPAFR